MSGIITWLARKIITPLSRGDAYDCPPPSARTNRGTTVVTAWNLTGGDELPDGITVLSVHREARGRTVRVVTDEPASAELPADSPVVIARRTL